MKTQAWLCNAKSIKINLCLFLITLVWLSCKKTASEVLKPSFRFEIDPMNYNYIVQFSDTSSVNPDFMYTLHFRNFSSDTLYIDMIPICKMGVGITQSYKIENIFDNWLEISSPFLDIDVASKSKIIPKSTLSFPVYLGSLKNGDCILIQPKVDFPPQYIRLPVFGGEFAFVQEPYAFFRYYDDTSDVFPPEFEDCTDSMTFEIRKNLK